MTENTYVTTDTGAKQVLCPAEVPAYDLDWLRQCETYLVNHGWENDGNSPSGLPTFRDPKGSRLRGEFREVATLPNKGDDLHPTITVRQFHVPPAPYSFTIEEAVGMQRRRDKAGDSGVSSLERIDVLELRCNGLNRELEQLKAQIGTLLTSHQLTFEGLKLGLRAVINQ